MIDEHEEMMADRRDRELQDSYNVIEMQESMSQEEILDTVFFDMWEEELAREEAQYQESERLFYEQFENAA